MMISPLPCKSWLYPLFCKICFMKKNYVYLKNLKREKVDIAGSCMAATIWSPVTLLDSIKSQVGLVNHGIIYQICLNPVWQVGCVISVRYTRCYRSSFLSLCKTHTSRSALSLLIQHPTQQWRRCEIRTHAEKPQWLLIRDSVSASEVGDRSPPRSNSAPPHIRPKIFA